MSLDFLQKNCESQDLKIYIYITNLTCLQTYLFTMVIEHHNSKVGDEAYV